MKSLIKYIGLVLSVAAFNIGCEKGPNYRDFSSYYPDASTAGIDPVIGFPGQEVSIYGENLDTLSGAVKVWFGGVLATDVVSSNGTEIVVLVPPEAVSGKVCLQVWTSEIDSIGTFTVLPAPIIKDIDLTYGMVGDTITITGENFGNDSDNITVLIGETEAQVNSVSDTEIKVVVPDTESGIIYVIVGSLTLEGTMFLIGEEKITGTIIGHESSWGNNPDTYIDAALDDDITTFVDAPSAEGYVGYDLGTGKAAIISKVRYVPRESHPSRMIGGEIRGANDASFVDYVTLYTISEEPQTGIYTDVELSITESYQYIYYYSSDGYCNVAEVEFYGQIVDVEIPQGKYVFEFNDGPREVTVDVYDDWIGRPDQSSWAGTTTTYIEDGYCKVTFASPSDGTNKNRADFTYSFGGDWGASGSGIDKEPWVYSKEYPIYAIKIYWVQNDGTLGGPRPADGNIYYDRLGQFNDDYVAQNVLWVDASVWAGDVDIKEEGSWWQMKIADILSDEQGYWVDWHRTFKSIQELETFIGL